MNTFFDRFTLFDNNYSTVTQFKKQKKGKKNIELNFSFYGHIKSTFHCDLDLKLCEIDYIRFSCRKLTA